MTRGDLSDDFSCFDVLMSFSIFVCLFWVVHRRSGWYGIFLRIGLPYGVHEGNATYVLMPRIVVLLTSISYQFQPLK